jgi:hypothetical protein
MGSQGNPRGDQTAEAEKEKNNKIKSSRENKSEGKRK